MSSELRTTNERLAKGIATAARLFEMGGLPENLLFSEAQNHQVGPRIAAHQCETAVAIPDGLSHSHNDIIQRMKKGPAGNLRAVRVSSAYVGTPGIIIRRATPYTRRLWPNLRPDCGILLVQEKRWTT